MSSVKLIKFIALFKKNVLIKFKVTVNHKELG